MQYLSPPRPIQTILWLCCYPLILLALTSCGEGTSATDEIEEYLVDISKQAKKKKVQGIKKYIASEYSDKYGYKRTELLRISAAYFLRTPSIHINYSRSPILFSNEETVASFTVVAAVSQEDLDPMDLRLTEAQFHRFDVRLEKKKKWLLHSLSWNQAKIDEYSAYLEQ